MLGSIPSRGYKQEKNMTYAETLAEFDRISGNRKAKMIQLSRLNVSRRINLHPRINFKRLTWVIEHLIPLNAVLAKAEARYR